jgi:hypothetical protein
MSDEPQPGPNIDPDDPRSKMAPVTSDPGHPQPEAAEVESARLLFNDTKDRLMADGLPEDDVRRLAAEYVALDKAGGARSSDDFVAWARERRTTRSG